MGRALNLLLQTGVYFTLKPMRLQTKTHESGFIFQGRANQNATLP